ncbi:hypothetical protein [Streptomyces sp. NRRL S-350]|uniref:hypothetical protein n=1 Tax=Streptomyces sp. NRRL S-350 TaxID=1463902 RepID=UPI0004C14A74|nr:hypothetical protein [Streptomyces sp. NRRL S-350]
MRLTTRFRAAEELAAATAGHLPARAGRAWHPAPGTELDGLAAAGLTDGTRTLLLTTDSCGTVKMAAWPAGCAPLKATAVPGRRVHPRHLAAAAARHHLPAADRAAVAAGPGTDGFTRRSELRYELCSSPLAPERRAVTDTEADGFKVCWNVDGTRITAAPSGDHAVVIRAERLRLPYAERLLRLALDGRSADDPATGVSGAAARRLAAAWPLLPTNTQAAGTTRLTSRTGLPDAPHVEIALTPGLGGADCARVDLRLRGGTDFALLALAALR